MSLAANQPVPFGTLSAAAGGFGFGYSAGGVTGNGLFSQRPPPPPPPGTDRQRQQAQPVLFVCRFCVVSLFFPLTLHHAAVRFFAINAGAAGGGMVSFQGFGQPAAVPVASPFAFPPSCSPFGNSTTPMKAPPSQHIWGDMVSTPTRSQPTANISSVPTPFAFGSVGGFVQFVRYIAIAAGGLFTQDPVLNAPAPSPAPAVVALEVGYLRLLLLLLASQTRAFPSELLLLLLLLLAAAVLALLVLLYKE